MASSSSGGSSPQRAQGEEAGLLVARLVGQLAAGDHADGEAAGGVRGRVGAGRCGCGSRRRPPRRQGVARPTRSPRRRRPGWTGTQSGRGCAAAWPRLRRWRRWMSHGLGPGEAAAWLRARALTRFGDVLVGLRRSEVQSRVVLLVQAAAAAVVVQLIVLHLGGPEQLGAARRRVSVRAMSIVTCWRRGARMRANVTLRRRHVAKNSRAAASAGAADALYRLRGAPGRRRDQRLPLGGGRQCMPQGETLPPHQRCSWPASLGAGQAMQVLWRCSHRWRLQSCLHMPCTRRCSRSPQNTNQQHRSKELFRTSLHQPPNLPLHHLSTDTLHGAALLACPSNPATEARWPTLA